jgi:glycine betaine/proline transport system substrate-binding protein
MQGTRSTLVLATIDLSFHHSAAGVVQAILEKHGVNVVELRAPHEDAFRLLKDGKADMLCSAWLPGSHEVYFAPVANDFEKLTVLYNPYALWGVPDFIPPDLVSTVADLTRPEVQRRMNKVIQGINPGAGISRFSIEIMEHYGLTGLGYSFKNGSLDDCVGAFERAVRSGNWVVVPLWQPQYLFASHKIRELSEPNGLLRGKDQATLVLRKNRLLDLPPAAIDELRATSLGNEEATRLDYLVSRGKMTPIEAGRNYLARRK